MSSLWNIYLSTQYRNMPDGMIKCLLLKQFQVSEIPGMWTKFPGSRLLITATQFESLRGRNHVVGTNIYSFCAINTQLHQTKRGEIYHTFVR